MSSRPKGAPGRVKEISSTANPIVKDLRTLAVKRNREERGLFLAEGQKLVWEALEQGWRVATLIYAKNAKDRTGLPDLAARIVARGGDVLEVGEKVLGTIARRDNPQTVMAVFEQRTGKLSDLRPGEGELVVALDRVRDPGNLGTIIRTADAAGVSAIVLIGECVDPFSMEAVRATMGSLFQVPIIRARADEFLRWREGFSGTVIGTHLEGSVDYRRIERAGDRPRLLLMGNEAQGLPDDLARSCDRLARIPQVGRADSLNLAVATALMIYELKRDALSLEIPSGEKDAP